MATINSNISCQVKDSRNETTSSDTPVQLSDAITVANLITAVQNWGVSLDTVTDGQITKIRICLSVPLPAGIKAAAVAGSDNEKTGLLTMAAVGTPNAYGVDFPAIPNSQLTGNQINTGAAAMTAVINVLQAIGGTLRFTDRYGNGLAAVLHGNLTFRKHRRSLRRA